MKKKVKSKKLKGKSVKKIKKSKTTKKPKVTRKSAKKSKVNRKPKKKSKLRTFLKIIGIILLIFLIGFLTLLSLREILPKDIDDLTPGMECDAEYLEKADIIWVIPYFLNETPSEEWCEDLRELGETKELAMHGIRHTFQEFSHPITEEELLFGMELFKNCTGNYPEKFKPPQLRISKENRELVKKHMNLEWYPYQVFHKVYHCISWHGATNEFMDLI